MTSFPAGKISNLLLTNTYKSIASMLEDETLRKEFMLPYAFLPINRRSVRPSDGVWQEQFTYTEEYDRLHELAYKERNPAVRKLLRSLSGLDKNLGRMIGSFAHHFDEEYNPSHRLYDLATFYTPRAHMNFLKFEGALTKQAPFEFQSSGLFSVILKADAAVLLNDEPYKAKPANGLMLVAGKQLTAYCKDVSLQERGGKADSVRKELVVEAPWFRITKPTSLLLYTVKY